MALTNESLWSQLSGLFSSNGGTQSFPAGDTTAGMTYGTGVTNGAVTQGQLADLLKGLQGNGAGTGIDFNIGTGQLARWPFCFDKPWGANKQMKLAEDQFDFTKKIATTNLNNQVKSYNTALEDRIRSPGCGGRFQFCGSRGVPEQEPPERIRGTHGHFTWRNVDSPDFTVQQPGIGC